MGFFLGGGCGGICSDLWGGAGGGTCTQVFVVSACRDSAPWDQHKNMQGGLILFF